MAKDDDISMIVGYVQYCDVVVGDDNGYTTLEDAAIANEDNVDVIFSKIAEDKYVFVTNGDVQDCAAIR